jgi:malate permease and related proteins
MPIVTGVIEVLVQNIIPIFLAAAVGYILRRRLRLDKRALTGASFYAFSPALVFSSLVSTKLDGAELLQIAGFTVIVTTGMGLVGLLSGRLLRLPKRDTVSLIIVLMFVNSGNYGLVLNRLRYGDDGLSRAIIYYVVSTILFFTIGVFLASMGHATPRQSVGRLLRLPAFYAVILAVLVYSLAISVPEPLLRAIEVTGDGAIPVMLIVLGMQVADIRSLEGLRLAIPASLLRLLVAPLLAVVVAGWLGLQGVGRAASILEASMPSAVLATVIAAEFDLRQGMITSTVVLSTLLSLITLPVLIIILGL